jgi:hypothetical protein
MFQKPKSQTPLSVIDLMKPPNYFPEEKAVTLIDKNMKIKPATDLDFLNGGRTITDYFVVTAVGKPLTGTNLEFLEYGSSRQQ